MIRKARCLVRVAPLFWALVVLLWSANAAHAVVNQVTGQVVPIQNAKTCPKDLDKCIQTGLNYGEGYNPPHIIPSGAVVVDAVLDANTGPETFVVPKDSSGKFVKVTFRVLQEGANYENIFGWYNVGKNTKRFPVIFSCEGGYKTLYEPPAYASSGKLTGGYSYTVDFQKEYEATGRYEGGQIGFYLISPEGSSNEDATGYARYCATDPGDQGTLKSMGKAIDDDYSGSSADDSKGFGRVYYTESKLNNDGNYVHYLIYQSKAKPTDFYFGFEDLFRGGDNDFDDTMIKLEGLVPGCQPTQEICNGKDDNCNSQVDENVTRSCTSKCGTGTEACSFTNDGNPKNDWKSCTAPTPTKEVCDGKDNDCDKIPDNLGTTVPCTSGGCKGLMKCVAGKQICDAPKQQQEICDGKDNDCDTLIDENVTRTCVNKCGSGTETCKFSDDGNPANDWVGCTAPTASTEICDGLDNDCNGTVDDNVSGMGKACDAPVTEGNTCKKGQLKCVGGAPTCVGYLIGSVEICDNKDNDCDGKTDEDNPCPTKMKCIKGWCRAPCTGLEFGCPKGYTCRDLYCIPDKCAEITCKGDEKCVDGKCINYCKDKKCQAGYVCVLGECIKNDCYHNPCTQKGYICADGKCVQHPCTGITCKAGEFCEKGTCRPSCGGVFCGENGRCKYGKCVSNACLNKVCDLGDSCVDGKCDTPCHGQWWLKGDRLCVGGVTIDHPCKFVKCYDKDEKCFMCNGRADCLAFQLELDGQCVSGDTYRGFRNKVMAGGGSLFCALPGDAPGPPPAPGLLLLLALLAVARRRRS